MSAGTTITLSEQVTYTCIPMYLYTFTPRLLYDPHAFLLDQERSSILPVMAAGLCSILFSIPVDADYLNTPSRSVDVTIMATPLSVGHAPSTTSALLEVQSKHNGQLASHCMHSGAHE